jgi:hypothetical protein
MKHHPNPPLRCIVCGCTDDNACILPNGQPCSWAKVNPPVCTLCAQISLELHEMTSGEMKAVAERTTEVLLDAVNNYRTRKAGGKA